MSSSPWTATQWDDFHRTGVEPPAPDVPPFRLEGLETRDPRRVGSLGGGDAVTGRDFEDGAEGRSERLGKSVSLKDARRAIPKVLAGWNVTFSPSTSSSNDTDAARRHRQRRANRESLLRESVFDESFGESDATGSSATARKEKGVFARARSFLRSATGYPSVKLSRRVGGARASSRDGSGGLPSSVSLGGGGGFGEAPLVVFGREMVDGELTVSVFPDLCVGLSVSPLEKTRAFVEAGVDGIDGFERESRSGYSPRSLLDSRSDAAESAFRVKGGVAVESGIVCLPFLPESETDRLILGAGVTLGASAGEESAGGAPPSPRAVAWAATQAWAAIPAWAATQASRGRPGLLRGGGVNAATSATSWCAWRRRGGKACGRACACGAASS
jgi:hypothetical protein